MSRALRILLTIGVTATSLAAVPFSHARAARPAAKHVLNITIQLPYADPATYLNAKTKASDPLTYRGAQVTQAIFTMFYKMHPDYVIQTHDWGWSDALRQKILLNVAAGNAPDVVFGEDFIPEFARTGVIQPIQLGSLRSDLASGPLSGGVYHGTAYAVPAITGVFALYYNKTLMRKAGLNPNTPPKTWDQWLADSKKIAALGGGVSGTAVEAATGLGAAFRIVPFLRQLGGDLTNKDASQITFDSPANVKALTFLRQLAATSAPGVVATSDEGKFLANTWWANKAGFYVDGPWEMASSVQNKVDYGVTALPLSAGGHQANVIVGNGLWAVTKLSKHPQAALDFVRLFATRQAAQLIYNATGRLPGNLAVLNNVADMGGPLRTFVDAIKLQGLTPLPAYPANPQQVWSTWYNVQLAALATTQPIPATLAKAQSDASLLLQQ